MKLQHNITINFGVMILPVPIAGAKMIGQPRFVSLLKMLDINARPFLGVATEIRILQMAIGNNVKDKTALVSPEDGALIKGHLELLSEALNAVGGKLALRSLERLAVLFWSRPAKHIIHESSRFFGGHREQICRSLR